MERTLFHHTTLLGAVLWLAFVVTSSASAQTPPDTSRVDTALVDTTLADTIPKDNDIPDSLMAPVPDSFHVDIAASIDDSIKLVFPEINTDTLTDNQRLLVEFETRYNLRKQDAPPGVEKVQVVSFLDTLRSWLLSPRLNLREDIDRSFYHDAGDYLRSDPGFFAIDYQVTPMRKTIQPFGVSGDRLGFLVNGRPIAPFEHVVEPDGLRDLNDIPTALDEYVAVVPGPVGALLGGRMALATLVTQPAVPENNTPESSFLVDKGSFSYSYARGRYARDFLTGRHIDMSVGYRNADGPYYGRGDDAYHYSGNVVWPVGQTKVVYASGWLYNREAPLVVNPDVGGASLSRGRYDRFGQVTFRAQNEARTTVFDGSYRLERQGSDIDGAYKGRFSVTNQQLNGGWEGAALGGMFRAEASGEYDKYHDGTNTHERTSAGGSLTFARRGGHHVLALQLRNQYVDGYRFLPAVSAVLARETDRWYWLLSAGYAERSPSLHELHLTYQEASLYNSTTRYADRGNPALLSEKQLVGSAEVEYGAELTNLGLRVTGGKVFDGIDWSSTVINNILLFQPINGDVTFVDLTAAGRLAVTEFLRFKAGPATTISTTRNSRASRIHRSIRRSQGWSCTCSGKPSELTSGVTARLCIRGHTTGISRPTWATTLWPISSSPPKWGHFVFIGYRKTCLIVSTPRGITT